MDANGSQEPIEQRIERIILSSPEILSMIRGGTDGEQ